MITVDKLESLDGSVSIPTKDILTFDTTGKIITGDGRIVLIKGVEGSGGDGPVIDPTPGGGTPGKVETPDTLIELSATLIDSVQDNKYEIVQEAQEPGWSKFQPIIEQKDFSIETSGGASMLLTKINFKIRSAGYQMVKILLYKSGVTQPIGFTRTDLNSLTLNDNPAITVDITSSGFMLVENTTYEVANVLNTAKLPTPGVSGWFSLTANTDANGAFEAIFSAPVEVSAIRIYRCGATAASFNGGTEPYDITLTDNTGGTTVIEVPKVSDGDFTKTEKFVSQAVASNSGPIDTESKKHNFSFSYSLDGVIFKDITPKTMVAKKNDTNGLYTYINTYNEIPITTTNQRRLFIKVPDVDIPFLKNVKIKSWYMV